MIRLALLSCLLLCACGVDGAPERPQTERPGLTVTGDARIGISTE